MSEPVLRSSINKLAQDSMVGKRRILDLNSRKSNHETFIIAYWILLTLLILTETNV